MALVAASALTLASCGGAAATPTTPPATTAPSATVAAEPSPTADAYSEVCAAAVSEGGFTHWHNNGDAMETVYAAFRAAHPGIDVEVVVLPNDQNAQRVLTEAAAGRQITPDLSSGSLDVFNTILERDLVANDIDWAGLGVSSDVVHERNFIRNFRVPFGLTYNTDRLGADDLPSTWEEVIDEKWRGRVVVDARGRPFDLMSLEWGREEALDYVKRLKETIQPIVVSGATNSIVAVISGEADFSTGGRSAETVELKSTGAPIDIKYLDVLPTNEGYNFIYRGARHPNAARCFVAWLARDGTEIFNEALYRTNDAIPPQAPAGAVVVSIESAEDAEAVQSVAEEMVEVWSGG